MIKLALLMIAIARIVNVKLEGALTDSYAIVINDDIKIMDSGVKQYQDGEFLIQDRYLDIEHQYNINGTVIVQLSDLHIDNRFNIDSLKNIVRIVNEAHPDIVVFTGDFLDANNRYSGDTKEIVNTLRCIKSTYGNYAVLGNHDRDKRIVDKAKSLLTDSGFKILINDKFNIEDIPITLYGIDVDLNDFSKSKKLDKSIFGHMDSSRYNILLNHYPDLIDYMSEINYQLQLSGHSHGGQIVIDGQPLASTPYGEKYLDGLYSVYGKELFVSRGIGYSRLPIRINAPSTIDIIRLGNN